MQKYLGWELGAISLRVSSDKIHLCYHESLTESVLTGGNQREQ